MTDRQVDRNATTESHDKTLRAAHLVVEGEVDAAVRDCDRPRLGVDDGVVDIRENAIGGDDVHVSVAVLVPRRTHRVRQIRVGFVVQQLRHSTARHATRTNTRTVPSCSYSLEFNEATLPLSPIHQRHPEISRPTKQNSLKEKRVNRSNCLNETVEILLITGARLHIV